MREHFWQSVPGYFSFHKFYSSVANFAAKSGKVNWRGVEVGVHSGQSAAYLAIEIANKAPDLIRCLDLVDSFDGPFGGPDEVKRRLKPVMDIVGDVHAGDPCEAAAKYADGSLDFCFINTTHDWPNIRRSLEAWAPKVRDGGWISGHGFDLNFPGVIQATTDAFEWLDVTRENWGTWRAIKGGMEKVIKAAKLPRPMSAALQMDHFYEEIPGSFTFESFYSWLAGQLPTGGRMVEVGTDRGRSAAYLGVEILNSGSGCKIDLVDLYPRGIEDVANRLAPVMGAISVIRQECSWEAARHYANGSLDAVFLDAGHQYECLKNDIHAWRRTIRPGGVLAGHDFALDIPGVIQAVAEKVGGSWNVWRGSRYENGRFYPVWWTRL